MTGIAHPRLGERYADELGHDLRHTLIARCEFIRRLRPDRLEVLELGVERLIRRPP
jgi:hypothetical protein